MLKIYQKTLFAILICTVLLSCNFSETVKKHNAAVDFINEVNSLDESIIPSSTQFSDYLQIVGPIAKNGSNYQLDQEKIDSLKMFYDSFMNSIDTATSKLSGLGEFDTSFNIIKPSIRRLEIIKNSYVSTVPTYLIVYKIGWKSANDSLKKIINEGPEILKNGSHSAMQQVEIKNSETTRFIEKYRFLNKE